MPTFLLTAKYDVNAANNFHIAKGQSFVVNVNMNGIQPNNLFNNQRCADALKQQLCTLYNFPPSVINRGRAPWDIQMI